MQRRVHPERVHRERGILVSSFLIALFWCTALATASPAPFTASVNGEPQQEDKSSLPQRQLSEKERKEREKRLKKELESVYKKWLNEDVSYIITDEERKVFAALDTEEEREQFIEQFWLRRDPTPDTAENEFKEEHYRRIAYANERFTAGKPGWMSDRGRLYILYGPPDHIDSHSGGSIYVQEPHEGQQVSVVYPFERWRYAYLEGIGTEIILDFLDKNGDGDYRLMMDPTEKEVFTSPGALTRATEPILRPGGADPGRGDMSQFAQLERFYLYSKVQRPPEIKFKDLEALVTTRISYNLLPFDLRQDFIRVTEDTVMVPLTIRIENDKMTFQQKEGLYSATVNVFGRVTSVSGRVVQTFEDVIAQQVPESLYSQVVRQHSLYQKSLLLRPGLYRLDLVLKDLNSGNVGTLNTRLAVPRFEEEKLSASSLILADLIEKVPLGMVGTGPFVIGGTKVRPSVGEQFDSSQRLGIYMQVYNLGLDATTHKPDAAIRYTVFRNGQAVLNQEEDAAQLEHAGQQVTLAKLLSVKRFPPGQYLCMVTVTDRTLGQTIQTSANFQILP